MAVEVAEVRLWGSTVGAVTWNRATSVGAFEYDAPFQTSGIELAPLMMPLGPAVRSFPELDRGTYWGLPGMLADSLPDKFGMVLIDSWLARRGRSPADFSPIERLCYVGNRGMGALEFRPATVQEDDPDRLLDVAHLVDLANRALATKEQLVVTDVERLDDEDLAQIIRVGTSAGGARAKAVIAWNETTGDVRSGQLDLPNGFTHWLLKFDGVSGNRDKELDDPLGFGRIEYAYSLMARAAGLVMAPARLLEEGGRAHFMTKRFDRVDGQKLHMQSLAAMAHFDFNRAGIYGYEQALRVMRELGLPQPDLTQQYRRAVFNVIARNQDDHTKNIAFLMDRRGSWSLAPAYDVTYSYNPDGAWTSSHQMSVNGQRDGFVPSDLEALAPHANLSNREARQVVAEVDDAVSRWAEHAAVAGVAAASTRSIEETHRRDLVQLV